MSIQRPNFAAVWLALKTVANFLLQLSSGGETKLQIFSAEDFALNTVFFAKSEPCWLSLCLAAEEMKLKKQLSSPSNEEISSLDLGTSQSRIAKVCFGDGWMLLLWMVWQGIWITDKKLALGEIYGQTGCFQARAKFQFY